MGGDKTGNVAERGEGVSGTSKWSLGGLDRNTHLTFIFEVADATEIRDSDQGFIQFQTSFRASDGSIGTRVTTTEVLFRDPKLQSARNSGLAAIKEHFDQDCAAVVMAKLAVFKKDMEFGADVMRWIDQSLIRFMKRCADYTPNRLDTFRLAPQFDHFHTYMFYLRRSQFLDSFGYSADEAAFHRIYMQREKVSNCLMMIEPLLYSYSTDGNMPPDRIPEIVKLDASSVRNDVVLLLDSFFTLVVWYGKSANLWRLDENLSQNPDYKWLFERLEAPMEERQARAAERYPYPVEIETWEGESQERFLLAKINPSSAPKQDGEERVLTDDVSLRVFEDHLKKLTVDDN